MVIIGNGNDNGNGIGNWLGNVNSIGSKGMVMVMMMVLVGEGIGEGFYSKCPYTFLWGDSHLFKY